MAELDPAALRVPGRASPGRLLAGTSGFAYRGWIPRFYPAGTRPAEYLATYAARLRACELNGTYYRWPTETQVRAWAALTPDGFRFSVKAQRAAAWRAMGGAATAEMRRLVAPLAGFGDHLGCLLLRVPVELQLDTAALRAVLAALPSGVPLTVELQHPTWHVDSTFELLRRHGSVLCATELDEDAGPPDIRITGPFVYLRLRRVDYSPDELNAWASRIRPFLFAGMDVYAIFRHDPVGRGPELALALTRLIKEADD